MSLQEEAEGGAGSPSSQYWLGSPNSHSNEDFEAWSSFRTRTSSDASTLSGRRSPFPSEQEDLVESDGLMMYPGTSGSKKTSALSSLSEVTGSMGRCGSEHVMESLLDNLHLLSPKAPQLGSDPSQSSTAAILQTSSYGSTGLSQDYSKCTYGQVRLALPETKPGFGGYETQYVSPAGLLQELLTADADTSRNLMSSNDTRGSDVGRTNCLMSTYCGPSHMGGHKLTGPPQSHPGLRGSPPSLHSQVPAASRGLNICDMIPLTSLTGLSGASQRVTGLGPPAHANGFPAGFNYRDLNSVYTHHHHHHHQERLPSDLDNMSIERFDCDMDSVLHDTLMDGGGLDFNFDPAAGPRGFSKRVKTTTHNWVSG